MNILISLLAIFSLAFLIKELDGPWNLISKTRNLLMRNKYVGVFFYKLFSCYYCIGFHCSYIIYFLQMKTFVWNFFILWILAGSIICIIIDAILNKLNGE